jgi:hypothetical protein
VTIGNREIPFQENVWFAMGIDKLLRIVAPPEQPINTGNGARWEAVERTLGTRLPADYRDFCGRYGTGKFAPWYLTVINPYDDWYLDMVNRCCNHLRAHRGLMETSDWPYGIFPSQPGWLPWGFTDDDDYFCWVTEGEPGSWPILILSDDRANFQQVRMSMTSFLARLFSWPWKGCFAIQTEVEFEPSFDGRFQFVPFDYRGQAPVPPVVTVTNGIGNVPDCPWDAEWFPVDKLARPTGARIVMGPGTMRTHSNGLSVEQFTAYPSWWSELPRPLHNWRRAQMLDWSLGGPAGSCLDNLIPLTWNAQRAVRGLQRAEASLVSRGTRISFTIQAVYETDNRQPSKLILESTRISPSPECGGLGPLAIPNK